MTTNDFPTPGVAQDTDTPAAVVDRPARKPKAKAATWSPPELPPIGERAATADQVVLSRPSWTPHELGQILGCDLTGAVAAGVGACYRLVSSAALLAHIAENNIRCRLPIHRHWRQVVDARRFERIDTAAELIGLGLVLHSGADEPGFDEPLLAAIRNGDLSTSSSQSPEFAKSDWHVSLRSTCEWAERQGLPLAFWELPPETELEKLERQAAEGDASAAAELHRLRWEQEDAKRAEAELQDIRTRYASTIAKSFRGETLTDDDGRWLARAAEELPLTRAQMEADGQLLRRLAHLRRIAPLVDKRRQAVVAARVSRDRLRSELAEAERAVLRAVGEFDESQRAADNLPGLQAGSRFDGFDLAELLGDA